MLQAQATIALPPAGPGLHEATRPIADWVAAQAIDTGLLTVFVRHTSASLLIQENASPDVLADMADFFRDLAPEDPRRWRHADEGTDDLPRSEERRVGKEGVRTCSSRWSTDT